MGVGVGFGEVEEGLDPGAQGFEGHILDVDLCLLGVVLGVVVVVVVLAVP